MSYLEIKNLQKKYTKDGPLVVNNMNLSIEKGEFIVFLGPSGCGKTTTIRMISGLEDSQQRGKPQHCIVPYNLGAVRTIRNFLFRTLLPHV